MALGASRSSVLSLVLVRGLRLVAVGLVLGGIAAMAMGSTVRALLFNTEPTDILTYAGVAIVLGIVARVACLMPARRASTVDPLVALRGN
jgi:ABC-type antimicrobial peptide transport system permease subunit